MPEQISIQARSVTWPSWSPTAWPWGGGGLGLILDLVLGGYPAALNHGADGAAVGPGTATLTMQCSTVPTATPVPIAESSGTSTASRMHRLAGN